MYFTTPNIKVLNHLRKDPLYNGNDVYLNNKISLRSLFKGEQVQGTLLSNTLNSIGDKKGSRDMSQYLRLKRGILGSSLLKRN